jgi:hypothetical protein
MIKVVRNIKFENGNYTSSSWYCLDDQLRAIKFPKFLSHIGVQDINGMVAFGPSTYGILNDVDIVLHSGCMVPAYVTIGSRRELILSNPDNSLPVSYRIPPLQPFGIEPLNSRPIGSGKVEFILDIEEIHQGDQK